MFGLKKILSMTVASVMTTAMMMNCTVLAEESFESASDCVASIGAGWNLGNTLDSNGTWITASAGDYQAYETAWGNPVTTQEMIDSVKAQGFNAIRIPVTWSQHIDGLGHVDSAWMARVKTVVDYCYNDGLYVILNVHHDTGEGGGDKVSWIFAETSNYEENSVKFAGLWTEIANAFKDYGDHLLFEGYNEMLDSGNTWNAPRNASSYSAVNNYAQLFVNSVRATGGNNSDRNLIVNTYVSSVDQAVLDNFVLPNDTTMGHLICEVHCYSPWGFTGTSQSVTWTSVHNDFGTGDKSEINDIMNRLKSFADTKGVPVIIGEYGAEFKNNEDQIASYASYFVDAAGSKGIKCFYWDNGDYKTSGEGGYAIFDRGSLTWKSAIVSAIVDAASAYTAAAEEPEPSETEETSEQSTEATAASSETSETAAESEPAITETAVTDPETGDGTDEKKISLLPFVVLDLVLVGAAGALVAYYLQRKKK